MRRPTDRPLAAWIRELEREGCIYKFYKCDEWVRLRAHVMEREHHECVRCRERGVYSLAQTVHHVNEVHHRPELALSEYYVAPGGKLEPNLLPLCNRCHNDVHGRTLNGSQKKADESEAVEKKKPEEPKPQLNEERW